VRNEPQHDYAPATTKTKIHEPLIDFSYSQKSMPFSICKLTGNLHEAQRAAIERVVFTSNIRRE
jgi:hypothetical protein